MTASCWISARITACRETRRPDRKFQALHFMRFGDRALAERDRPMIFTSVTSATKRNPCGHVRISVVFWPHPRPLRAALIAGKVDFGDRCGRARLLQQIVLADTRSRFAIRQARRRDCGPIAIVSIAASIPGARDQTRSLRTAVANRHSKTPHETPRVGRWRGG